MSQNFIHLLFLASLITIALSATTSGCGQPLPPKQFPGGSSHDVNFTQANGTPRTYRIHIPSTYDINAPVSLIFSFHGRNETAIEQEVLSQFSNEEFNPNAFAVYPQGINKSWEGDPALHGIDDVGFTHDLIANFLEIYCLDDSRIYATGKSEGGGFTNILACDNVLSHQIAAFAPVSGAFYIKTSEADCKPQTVTINCTTTRTPVPMLEFHGSIDPIIKYSGGWRRGECLPTIPHWVREWSIRDGFGLSNKTTNLFGGNVTEYQYGAGEGESGTVTHYLIQGLGHAWPSTEPNHDNPNGTYINATSIIMEFFGNYTL